MGDGGVSRPAFHRKLTEKQLTMLTEQARLRACLVGYPVLAYECGLSHGSIKQLMADLIREERRGWGRVRRGADRGELAAQELEL